MKGQRVVLVDEEALAESEIELGVLRIGDVEEGVFPFIIHLSLRSARDAVKQVASRLKGKTDGVGIRPIVRSRSAKRHRGVGEVVVPVHDEQVLVVVLEDSIAVLRVAQVLLSECVTYPRHEDIVDVQEVEAMLKLPVLACPSITQDTCKDTPVELGSVLRVESKINLRRGLSITSEGRAKEGKLEVGKGETRLDAVLDEVLVGIAAQALYRLKSTAKLDVEKLRAAEDVSVLIGQAGCCAKVACRVRSLQLCAEGVVLVGRQGDVDIEGVAIAPPLLDTNIRPHHSAEPSHAGIRLVHVLFPIETAGRDGCRIPEHLGSQERLIVAEVVTDVTYMIAMMREVRRVGILPGTLHYHLDIGKMLPQRGIDAEMDIVLVELVVAVLHEQAVELASLGIEGVDVVREGLRRLEP